MNSPNLWQRGHSWLNGVLLQGRNYFAFTRGGYCEAPTDVTQFQQWLKSLPSPHRQELQALHERIDFADWFRHFNLETIKLNYTTWQILDAMLADYPLAKRRDCHAIDAGCQSFRRLPAMHKCLAPTCDFLHFKGIELDAFPLLDNFHSRYDVARYYCQHHPGSRYIAADFFLWSGQTNVDIAFCFYPFVSMEPSLAWGIPAQFGNAEKWVSTLQRCLVKDGVTLVVHQGDWEEKLFYSAIQKNKSFDRINQKTLHLLPELYPYPVHVSLYRKTESDHRG